jgi:uncharacterized metal-binding protein
VGEEKECTCNVAPKLIFACSGASDTGEITDRAARKLAKEGRGKMYCLAGIGGRIESIMANTAAASEILVIDGCSSDCARFTLEHGGFTQFKQVRLSDLGMEKGVSPVTDERIARVVETGRLLLGD